jgi:hypothetical protein
MAKKQGITRDTLTAIEAQKIGSGMPVTTQGVGGDARAMLLRFHANFPFVGIEPFPAEAAMVEFDGSGPVDIDFPDATLWFTVTAIGDVFVGVPGIAPSPLVVQQMNKGGFLLPQHYAMRFFAFGKKGITCSGGEGAVASFLFYQQVETGLGQAPQLGI